jgi:hypothetical protein
MLYVAVPFHLWYIPLFIPHNSVLFPSLQFILLILYKYFLSSQCLFQATFSNQCPASSLFLSLFQFFLFVHTATTFHFLNSSYCFLYISCSCILLRILFHLVNCKLKFRFCLFNPVLFSLAFYPFRSLS